MKDLPVSFLNECFDYDQKSGVLYWKERPRKHFKTDRGWRVFNSRRAGKEAGTVGGTTGYIYINLGGELGLFPAHRIIWAMVHSVWPEKHIDHKDHQRANNRVDNLRECERSENQCNRGAQSNNTSGFKGVHLHSDGRWRAKICKKRKHVHLGLFDTPGEAHAAYVKASAVFHGEFARI